MSFQIGVRVGRAPLGFRFWDFALEQAVTDGLRVLARPAHSPQASAVTALLSGRDRYAFPQLPGVRLPVGTAEPERQQEFLIGIYDLLGRFLPVALRVDLPHGTVGLYPERKQTQGPGGPESREQDPPRFPLFSAPTRRSAPGMAVMRGEVWDGVGGRPAAHAMVRIKLGAVEVPLEEDVSEEGAYYSVADAQGRFCLMFPLPPAHHSGNGSHIATVWVRYQRRPLSPLPGSALPWIAPTDLPDLREITDQAPALIAANGSQSPFVLTRLHEGTDTILRTSASRVRTEPGEPGSAFVVYPS